MRRRGNCSAALARWRTHTHKTPAAAGWAEVGRNGQRRAVVVYTLRSLALAPRSGGIIQVAPAPSLGILWAISVNHLFQARGGVRRPILSLSFGLSQAKLSRLARTSLPRGLMPIVTSEGRVHVAPSPPCPTLARCVWALVVGWFDERSGAVVVATFSLDWLPLGLGPRQPTRSPQPTESTKASQQRGILIYLDHLYISVPRGF